MSAAPVIAQEANSFIRWRLAVSEASQHCLQVCYKNNIKILQVSVVCLWRFIIISIFPMCCFVQWFIDAIVICSVLKPLEQWTKWIGRPGVWTLKMHEVSTHFIVGLMQSPSDSWSPQLRVSECNPFCWSQHKMCTCCIYLLLLRTQNEFVSSSSRALPSMSKVRI